MIKVVFHANQLGLRGTETAMFNYADYNEKILGNKSIILANPDKELTTLKKFQDRFEIYLDNPENYEKYCENNDINFFYHIHGGWYGHGIEMKNVRTLHHVVFGVNEPHGDRYVYVSDWLAKNQGFNPETHSIPHIVKKFDEIGFDLRDSLGIPKNKTVFGCLGGGEEFNIDFVKNSVINVAKKRNDIVFLFLNISPFGEQLPNVIFLPGTYDMNYKASFIRACDAMIHARGRGETFGLSVSEFAIENKPVITFLHSPEKSHIELLGNKGIYYTNYDEVYDILNNLKNYIKFDNYYECYESCSPDNVMKRFQKLFLD
jgi:glycosyltransferase involved in cell wall biosynthesis